jgi:hypothetical protein
MAEKVQYWKKNTDDEKQRMREADKTVINLQCPIAHTDKEGTSEANCLTH